MMHSAEFFKNVDRPGASEDGVLCCRKSSAAEEFSYSSARPVGLQRPMEKRQCFLLEFKRSPETYRQCLANEPTLAAAVRCLEDAGYNTQLDTNAKVFLAPDLWPPVLDYLRKGAHSLCRPDDLQFRHVITDEKHRIFLLSAVDALRRKWNIKVKREVSFCVDVPCKQAWVLPPPDFPWETMSQPPKAWKTLELDFQPGSPAEIQWCEDPEL